ncbi:unnamed protein product, partial [Brassica rapa subsp. trilocularis]
MSKFGDFEDCIVMKVFCFSITSHHLNNLFLLLCRKDALKCEHVLGNRILEVKVATPKEEMRHPAKKATRIFVERYGEITDLYMPKDPKRSGHRGFGFATFAENGVADVYPGDLMKSVDKSWDMECRAQDNQDQTGGTGH